MARAPFSIYARSGRDGKKFYSARFFDTDGTVIKSVVLREAKSVTAASRLASKMLADGVVSNSKNPLALEYLESFWKPDSDYVRGRALRGVVLSTNYITINGYLVAKHLSKALKGKRLLEVTPLFLEKLVLKMDKEGCSARTINTTLQALKVPFGYFCRQHRLANALTSVEKLRESPRERGILTADEIGRVIALEGESPRAVASVLLGALCGLRLGEVRGLQWEDIDEAGGTITICHNTVNAKEGLKGPKWKSIRTVPAPAPVLEAMNLCAAVSPYEREGYVIWNEKRKDAPISHATVPAGFYRILRAIGISDKQRAERNLCFHGLRHTFVSLTRAASVPDFLVQRMAGHKTMVMTNRYSHTEGLIDFAAAKASIEAAVARKAMS